MLNSAAKAELHRPLAVDYEWLQVRFAASRLRMIA